MAVDASGFTIDENGNDVEDTALGRLIEAVNQAIKSGVLNELVCELRAPVSASVLKRLGGYRTAPLNGTEEFILKGARASARGKSKFIFEFTPVDPLTDYTQVEFTDDKVFDSFPELEPLLLRVFDMEPIDTDDAPVRFFDAKKLILKALENEIRDEARRIRKAEEDRIRQEQELEIVRNSDNPLYGAWGDF